MNATQSSDGGPPRSIDPERITVEFDKAAGAAMKQRFTRIFRLSHCLDLSHVQFGIIFRHEAEIAHVGVGAVYDASSTARGLTWRSANSVSIVVVLVVGTAF